MKNSFIKGISIVEIIVASAIIATSVVGIVGAIQIYLKIVHQNTRETQAVLLLDETAEALQSIRDTDYDLYIANTSLNSMYTIFWDGSKYQLSTSTINLPYNMTRAITFQNVSRDGSDQIVANGGTVDPNTKKAIITISWPYTNETKTITSELLLHAI